MSKVLNRPSKFEVMKFKVAQSKPQILTYGGIVGMASGTAAGIVATAKLPGVLNEMDDKIAHLENGDLTGEDLAKAIRKEKLQTYGKIGLMYAPAAVLTVGGALSVLSGFGLMKARYTGAVAALAVTTEAFNAYRERVVEEYGEDVDYKFKHNIRTSEEVIQHEDGTTEVKEVSTYGESQYSRIFSSSTSSEWQKDYQYNYAFIDGVEKYVNTILSSRGHVFLNEVYTQLGLKPTDAGQVVGWIYKDGGDGYIDLGLSDYEKHKDFINGGVNEVLLDFNVDGPIIDAAFK